MKRALHIINAEFYSGAERVQDHLAAKLPEHGYEVDFACLKPVLFPKAALARPETIHPFPMQGRFDLRPAWRIATFVRDQDISILHTHTPRAALIGSIAARLTGRPLIHHLHSPTKVDTETGLRNRFNSLMERLSTLNAVRFIAVSEHTADWYRHGRSNPGRVVVVHNGVPPLGPLPQKQPPEQGWILGTVALFRPRKGLEVLIEAIATLKSKGRPVRLLGVGNFETEAYRQSIFELTRRLGVESQMEWAGFTNDVPGMLQRMDCFVLPSLYGEGLPMVVLEAMAAGTPVISTNVEGVSEAVRDKIEGLLILPGHPEALADAVETLMDDGTLWSRIRTAAHARQQEHFSDESMARNVAAVYDEVLRV